MAGVQMCIGFPALQPGPMKTRKGRPSSAGTGSRGGQGEGIGKVERGKGRCVKGDPWADRPGEGVRLAYST